MFFSLFDWYSFKYFPKIKGGVAYLKPCKGGENLCKVVHNLDLGVEVPGEVVPLTSRSVWPGGW